MGGLRYRSMYELRRAPEWTARGWAATGAVLSDKPHIMWRSGRPLVVPAGLTGGSAELNLLANHWAWEHIPGD